MPETPASPTLEDLRAFAARLQSDHADAVKAADGLVGLFHPEKGTAPMKDPSSKENALNNCKELVWDLELLIASCDLMLRRYAGKR